MFGHKNTGVKGYLLLDGKEVAQTAQCCHCSAHFVVQKGSGKRRGFCLNCQGPTCGIAACDRCLPFEARCEFVEATCEQKNGVLARLLSRYPDLPLFPL